MRLLHPRTTAGADEESSLAYFFLLCFREGNWRKWAKIKVESTRGSVWFRASISPTFSDSL